MGRRGVASSSVNEVQALVTRILLASSKKYTIMEYQILERSRANDLTSLFQEAFASSEGEAEGRLIGKLSSELASNIDNDSIICIGAANEEDSLRGVIFFTRLFFDSPVQVYMLAPVAVHHEHQGRGIGAALIEFGLDDLRNRSADVAVTYGDPSFYSKFGFEPLQQEVIQAPMELSMPFGWLGQSLTDEPIPEIRQRPTYVEELDDPQYW